MHHGRVRNFPNVAHQLPRVRPSALATAAAEAAAGQDPAASATKQESKPQVTIGTPRLAVHEEASSSHLSSRAECGACRCQPSIQRAGAVPVFVHAEERVVDENKTQAKSPTRAMPEGARITPASTRVLTVGRVGRTRTDDAHTSSSVWRRPITALVAH